MKFTIKVDTIILAILSFITISIPYFSQRTNNIISLICEVILIIWCIVKRKNFLKENLLPLIFGILIVFCTFINVGFSTRLITAIVFALKVLLFFIICNIVKKESSSQYLINTLFKIFFVVLMVTDTVILGTKGRGVGRTDFLSYYIIGNKFQASYFHMLFLCLFQHQNCIAKTKYKHNIVYFLLAIYTLLICNLVDCTTGIIGTLVILVVKILNNNAKISKLLHNPIFFLAIFAGATIILVSSNIIIENQYIQYIIVDVFNRTLTLTGRLKMHEITLNAIKLKPLFGYGINSTYVESVLSFGNTQNGLLKMLLDYGYIGTISFLMVCYSCFAKVKQVKSKKFLNKSFVEFLYGMAICSMVEINLSGAFYLGLAILKVTKNDLNEGE